MSDVGWALPSMLILCLFRGSRFMQNMCIYLGESLYVKGFSPVGVQKVHEQKTVKSHQNEHARHCPQTI
jgi:hypothetical protein